MHPEATLSSGGRATVGNVLRRLLEWLPVVGVVVAAVLLAGWGEGNSSLEESAPAPTPRLRPFADATSLSGAEAQSLVRNVRLEPRDLSADFAPVAVRSRVALDEQPGGDLCGAVYPSDAFRLAMRSDAFRAEGGRRVRTRVIAYERGRAEQAVGELRAAAPACTRPVPPEPVQQPGTLALRVRSSGTPGRPGGRELVVERRGDVVVLLDTERLPASTTLDLARRLSVRLVTLQPVGD